MRNPLLFGILLCGSSLQAAAPWWHAFGPVKQGDYGGGHADEELSPDQKAVTAMKEFPEWTTYEDEFVRLHYPKHPEIKFEISKRGEGIKVEGGVCTSVDNSFQQAYVLKVGKATYGVFLLNPAKWLDDGMCLCGPMVHHAYTMREKCLVRYSLLPGGAVKKAQVLGGNLRLMAFEWTHLACPREIYQEMVDGMTLKIAHPHGEPRLKEEIAKRYGLEGKAGWLHPGQSLEEMFALMGSPKKQADTEASWEEEFEDYMVGVRVSLQEGKFDRMDDKGVTRVSGPLEGTLTWVEKNAGEVKEREGDPFDSERDGDAEKSKAAAEILRPTPEAVSTALIKLAPSCHGYEWRTWCNSVVALAKHRAHRNEELIQIVRDRSSGRSCELEALEAYEQPGIREWVKTSLEKLAASDPGKDYRSDPTTESADWLEGDAEALLGWLVENEEPAAVTAAKLLLEADKPAWAAAVFSHKEVLPPDLVTTVLVQSLRTAIAKRDGYLVEKILTSLSELEIGDPMMVHAEVSKLPEGTEGSEWHLNRKAALEKLATLSEKSGD